MIFETAGRMWESLITQCISHGHRRNDTQELIGVSATLEDPTACIIYNRVRKCDLGYLGAELAWYLSGSDRLEHLRKYAPSYDKFSDDGHTANGAYGARGLGLFELEALAERIAVNPTSRQHVIPLWRARDIGTPSKDVPCTVSLQFLVVGDALHLVVYMRSNDLYLGFLYDVPAFCMILQLMCSLTGFALGHYHHHVGSLHIYDRNDMRAVMAAATCSLHWAGLNIEEARRLVRVFEGTPASEGRPPLGSILKAMNDARDRRSRLHGEDNSGKAAVEPPSASGTGHGDSAPESVADWP